MKKIMLLPALCFVLCLGLLFFVSPGQEAPPVQPDSSEQSRPEEDAPPFLVPSDEPAPQSPAPETQDTPAPQQTATPLSPDHEDYFETFFLPVTNTAPPNQELQNYLPQQVSINGSHMTFTAEDLDGQYVSGSAESIFGFLYGSLTVRFNNISNPGLFPAIWMLPASHASYPEVDIYECIGRDPQNFYGVMHYLASPDDPDSKTREYFQYTFDGPLPQSSTLRFDWTPDAMVWYLNGQKIYTITQNVPQVPLYLILNLAVGGTWCGDPTPDTVMPAVFDVDILDFSPQEIYTR